MGDGLWLVVGQDEIYLLRKKVRHEYFNEFTFKCQSKFIRTTHYLLTTHQINNMLLRKLVAMNLITFTHLRSAISWSTGSINNRCFHLTHRRSGTRRAFSVQTTSASSSDQVANKIYILHFASHIHKHTKDTGIGIAIYDAFDGKKIWTGRHFIPFVNAVEKNTNNLADYMALADGLKAVHNLKNTQNLISPFRVEIQTSNRVIAKHLSKEFKVATKSLKPWYEIVTNLMNSFDGTATGQIPPSDCGDVKKISELAVKEKKSCDNYLEVVGGKKKCETVEAKQSDVTEIHNQEEPADVMPRTIIRESQSSTSEISPDKVYILRFDGGSRGNPGVAGAGMALYDSHDGSEIWSGCLYLGDHRTNNEAEYMGLITGLQCALSLGIAQVVVQGDSKLVLEQVSLRWKVKSPSLKHYFDEAIDLKKQFSAFETSHIERAKNARADELANEAMDTKCSRGFNQM